MKNKMNGKFIIGGIGLVMILVYTVLLLTGYRSVSPETDNIVSKELDGYYIFSTLLKQLGYKVKKTSSQTVFLYSGAMICLEHSTPDAREEQRFREWLDKGNTLFLIGLQDTEAPLAEIPVEDSDPEPLVINPPLNSDVHEISWQPVRYFDLPGEEEVLLETTKGAVLIKRELGKGRLYLMPGSELFTNRYMQEEDAAVLVNNLFAPYYTTQLYLYEQMPIFDRMPSPVLILFTGNLFFFTLHLLLMAGIFLYWKGIRFGNAVVYRPYARRTISSHIQAVGNFYFRAKANKIVDNLEAAYFLHKMHKIAGEHKNLSVDELAAFLAEHHGVPEEDFKKLAAGEDNITTELLLTRRNSRNKLIRKISRSDYGKLHKYP